MLLLIIPRVDSEPDPIPIQFLIQREVQPFHRVYYSPYPLVKIPDRANNSS